jgi:hypothetical protein
MLKEKCLAPSLKSIVGRMKIWTMCGIHYTLVLTGLRNTQPGLELVNKFWMSGCLKTIQSASSTHC